MRRRRTIAGLLAALAAAALGWWLVTATSESAPATTAAATVAAGAAATTDPASGLPWIAPAELPAEGRETLALIAAGGPFPYARDGVTFQNREGILPDEVRGYYREYTVPTPGSDDRGARRIVAGAGGEQYYSDDHYSSFRRIGP
jgi:ribonuclease T1